MIRENPPDTSPELQSESSVSDEAPQSTVSAGPSEPAVSAEASEPSLSSVGAESSVPSSPTYADDSRFRVHDRVEIERILESLRLLRLPVSVRFPEVPGSHVSMVIAVDAGSRHFFLDLLGLAEGRRRMEAKDASVDVHGMLDGVTLVLPGCRAGGLAQVDSTEAHRVSFPDHVIFRQRRDNYRARVLRSMEIPFTLRGRGRRGVLSGHLDDVSNLGCRLIFRQPPDPPLVPGEIFADLQIQAAAPFGRMTMAVETRHVELDPASGVVASGFRFVDLKPQVRTQVQRFVVHLQREALRAQRR